jgi:hypothetical protein
MTHAIEMLRRFGPAYVKLGKTVLYDRTDLVAFESVDLGSQFDEELVYLFDSDLARPNIERNHSAGSGSKFSP